MPVKLCLAVEGVNDGGALGRSPSIRANDPRHEGALQALIRRAAPDASFELVGLKVNLLSLAGITTPAAARGKRAHMASALAAYDGCEALVVHQDVDGPADGSAGDDAADWGEATQAINDGFHAAEAAGSGLPAADCVAAAPHRTIEAWLLGDLAAIARVAKDRSEDVSTLAAAPERLWGMNGVSGSSHPKMVLRRAIGGPACTISTLDYRRLAEEAAIERIQRSCPLSFRPFARHVRRVARRLGT